jgi:hypothetical protein
MSARGILLSATTLALALLADLATEAPAGTTTLRRFQWAPVGAVGDSAVCTISIGNEGPAPVVVDLGFRFLAADTMSRLRHGVLHLPPREIPPGGWSGPVAFVKADQGSLELAGLTGLAQLLERGGRELQFLELARDSAPQSPAFACVAFRASPNPRRVGATWVEFSLRAPGVAQLRVLDVQGRVVADAQLGELSTGPHRISLDEACPGLRLGRGIYFVQLDAEGARQRTRLVVTP